MQGTIWIWSNGTGMAILYCILQLITIIYIQIQIITKYGSRKQYQQRWLCLRQVPEYHLLTNSVKVTHKTSNKIDMLRWVRYCTVLSISSSITVIFYDRPNIDKIIPNFRKKERRLLASCPYVWKRKSLFLY